MISHQEVLTNVFSQVSDKVADAVKKAVTETVTNEFLTTAVEIEFYRRINEEMRTGLKDIYRELVAAASNGNAETGAAHTKKLFSDATKQIEEIMLTTFEATEKIMSAVEVLLDQQKEAEAIVDSLKSDTDEKNLTRLEDLNSNLGATLTDIITHLSFQDLTGQRLKKVVSAMDSIRDTVFDLYVSTGLMLKGKEETPDKDISQIAAESKLKTTEIRNSELKGPTTGSSQKKVDDLLASLGL